VGYDGRALRKDKLNKNYDTMINDEKKRTSAKPQNFKAGAEKTGIDIHTLHEHNIKIRSSWDTTKGNHKVGSQKPMEQVC